MGAEIAAYQPRNAGTDTTVSDRVLQRIADSVPASTRRAYAYDWKGFAEWCAREGRTAMPATTETLAQYASDLADRRRAPASIMRAVSAIRVAHKLSGHPAPEALAARAVLKAYRNERAGQGVPNEKPATAMSVNQLKTLAGALDPAAFQGLRDRLILVLGWAMMARRSELARLNIEDAAEVEEGLDITVRKAKADQMASGRKVAVPYGTDPLTCPVRLMRSYLAALAQRGITTGPLFRRIDRHGHVAGENSTPGAGRGSADGRMSDAAIHLIVRRTVLKAGIPGTAIKPHSLRAGGATGAYLSGADLLTIGRHGGWNDNSTVLARYIRDVDRWTKNPMRDAGL